MNFRVRLKRTIVNLQMQSRYIKASIVIGVDLILLVSLVFVAYALRVSSLSLLPWSALPLSLLGPILSIASAAIFGAYGAVTRTYSKDTEYRIMLSQFAVLPVWMLISFLIFEDGFSRSTIVIYFLLSVLAMIGLRRFVANTMLESGIPIAKNKKTAVIIYGAGREGVALAEGLVRQGIYRPVAFIDTDYTLVGRKVAGLKVYSTEEIGTVLTYYDPKEVMVAKAQTDRRSRRALVDMFVQAGLQVKIIPDLQELADGRIELSALRPIRVEDLLGRDPVPADRILMEKAVKGRVIMVTGAGGSIGSELVRQAASFAPTKIVMVDNNEFALFEINRDMEAKRQGDKNFGLKLVPVLADVVDIDRMEVIIFEHKVEVVLHAAAYKHVRMVQENILAGIRNNVVGTKQLAEAAMRQKVSLFILISTDKAVRPTSIMGATKRISEMIIQALSRHKDNKTVFTMVRFGNVLGSTGSVVPLFREQISRGGPVLVTHPDVTRFFMLIPEAAQLVIQAGAMGTGGDVFVLDMGESVKIIDLAHTMIELAGLSPKTEQNPEGDIEVKFIGLQEGEKLFEELQIGRDVSKTPHPRIMRTNEFYLPWTKLDRRLTALKQSLDKNDPKRAVMDVMELARMEE